jgi:hypothetical protein
VQTGITHSLDFPIDVEFDTPPALDVLIAACKPYQTADYDDYHDPESLFYPPNLPVATTFDLSNHPILEAIKNTLFPHLPKGNYLTAVRDKLEVLPTGGRTFLQQRPLTNDGRVATVIVTLPVRFRGGSLVIYGAEGSHEKFYGRGGKTGDIEWTAFLADCDYEVETVQKGCRITLSYALFLKTFGPAGTHPDPLINPSENFLDLLSPVLNMSRGRKLGFYLAYDYGVNPSESVAESLVPEVCCTKWLSLVLSMLIFVFQLKGGDSILYHALKLFKLAPELHWTAGGFIWPINRAVECGTDPDGDDLSKSLDALQLGVRRAPAIRSGAFSTYEDVERNLSNNLRWRVEDSGALPLAESDILVLTPWNGQEAVGKERVPFVSMGELEKLVVNVLLVAYVP